MDYMVTPQTRINQENWTGGIYKNNMGKVS